MASPTIILDGSQAYGSRVLTINSVAYIANSINIDRPVTEAEDFLAAGAPGRKRSTAQRATFTAELQLATSSTVYPARGMTFTDTFDSQFGAETFVIDVVPHQETNDAGAIRTLNVSGWKVINGITTVA